jgi:catechol-2,3-dioxygenase
MNTLPSSISMGSVMLRVADLDSMTRYYSNVLGEIRDLLWFLYLLQS